MVDVSGLPPLPKCFSEAEISNLDSEHNKDDPHQNSNKQTLVNGEINDSKELDHTRLNGVVEDSGVDEKPRSPYSRLNNALSKLREEMAGLRRLDVSLLTQLWSLNDAIHEYKSAIQDRFSETNSEYSWGMNSRTSSMCSIDECDDWTEDLHMKLDHGQIGNSLHSSTSSLLQQINELKERAESEF
ncbi:leucine repeat adapter protein 25-like [Saccostrea echinata]|uniref:leucine repeat adapter protein 25-like n=1 Tax=Saccostrea echinata TaxID=191078 RepID=UPI002A7F0C6A|nr:leucine repeat adapter protein 25-like [Saccostrea echinata]